MSAQVIPVRTTGPMQTEWTDSAATVHQDLMGQNVKQVTVGSSVCHEQIQSGSLFSYFHISWV